MKGLLERAKKEVNNGKSIKKETKIKIFSCIVIGTIIIIAAMLFLLSKNNNLKLNVKNSHDYNYHLIYFALNNLIKLFYFQNFAFELI